jgi:hypothetical protein
MNLVVADFVENDDKTAWQQQQQQQVFRDAIAFLSTYTLSPSIFFSLSFFLSRGLPLCMFAPVLFVKLRWSGVRGRSRSAAVILGNLFILLRYFSCQRIPAKLLTVLPVYLMEKMQNPLREEYLYVKKRRHSIGTASAEFASTGRHTCSQLKRRNH